MKPIRSTFLALTVALSAMAQPASADPLYVGGAASDVEQRALEDLIQAAHSTLQSDLFRENLSSLAAEYPAVFIRMDGTLQAPLVRNGSISDLTGMVRSTSPFRYVRSPVALIGANNFYYALAGITGDGLNGSFTLGRGNLGNWLSPNVVTRSCAVNTVAHEMSHLISSDAAAFRFDTQPIRDFGAGRNSGTNAVASYLIGTAAQCTWLQAQGYSPAVDFKICVGVFGHRGFNGGRCAQFAAGQAIAPRQDLFAEHVIVD